MFLSRKGWRCGERGLNFRSDVKAGAPDPIATTITSYQPTQSCERVLDRSNRVQTSSAPGLGRWSGLATRPTIFTIGLGYPPISDPIIP